MSGLCKRLAYAPFADGLDGSCATGVVMRHNAVVMNCSGEEPPDAGVGHASRFAMRVLEGECPDLPEVASGVIVKLCGQLVFLHEKIPGYSRKMARVAQTEERVALLQTIPGVGPITASAIVATVGAGKQFNNGREFAAWLGLTPLNRSSGEKERLGRISKVGD